MLKWSYTHIYIVHIFHFIIFFKILIQFTNLVYINYCSIIIMGKVQIFAKLTHILICNTVYSAWRFIVNLCYPSNDWSEAMYPDLWLVRSYKSWPVVGYWSCVPFSINGQCEMKSYHHSFIHYSLHFHVLYKHVTHVNLALYNWK